jgi:DHA1 family bicyclomycin/chloramphenicol resistance-like MFS transporter
MSKYAASPHPGLGFAPFVLLIAALQAMGALGTDAMLPNLPAIGASFHLARENQQQIVVTSYLIGLGAGQIAYGLLSDRFGRKPVLLTGIALFVTFSALASFSPSFPILVAARVLEGMGAAASRSVPIAIVRDCYAGRQMARIMSLVFMVFLGVPMLAPTIGQTIGLIASWRWVFGFLTLFGAGVFVWTALKLPETLHPQDRMPIVASRIVHNFAVALKSRPGMGYALAITCISGALFGFVNAAQQIFQDVFKAPALFPAVFAFVAGSIAVGSLLNARLVGRLGMRPLSHWALMGFIVMTILHASVALGGRETLLSFALLQAGSMFGFGLISGNFGAMAMEPLGHVAGAAASLQGSLSMVGGALIGFFISQQFNGSTVPITIGFALSGLGALGFVLYAEGGRLFRPHHPPVAVVIGE